MRTIALHDAVAMIPGGASAMICGFMGPGTPKALLGIPEHVPEMPL